MSLRQQVNLFHYYWICKYCNTKWTCLNTFCCTRWITTTHNSKTLKLDPTGGAKARALHTKLKMPPNSKMLPPTPPHPSYIALQACVSRHVTCVSRLQDGAVRTAIHGCPQEGEAGSTALGDLANEITVRTNAESVGWWWVRHSPCAWPQLLARTLHGPSILVGIWTLKTISTPFPFFPFQGTDS